MTARAKTVTAEYLMGIAEGREWFKKYGMEGARENLENIERTCFLFAASSPVGQMLRGERDFWKLQIKLKGY